MQDVWSICTSSMHASFECPSVGPSDVVTEQLNAVQRFPPINNPYSNIYNHDWKNHPKFFLEASKVDLHRLFFKTKGMPIH